jgi:glycosyltransferase involved in cell wall biosynthesis
MPRRNKINIVYIVPTLDQGGAERFIVDLILSLNPDDFAPHLILLKRGGEWLSELTAKNIPVTIIQQKSKLDIASFFKLIAELKKIKPVIVHTELGGDIYGQLAARISKVPVVLSTEQNVNYHEKFLPWLAKRIISHWSDQVVAISQAVARDARQRYHLNDQQLIIIPNGLPTAKFPLRQTSASTNKSTLLFGSLGRLVPQKGYASLIKAWGQLTNKNLNCAVAGAGYLQTELQQNIEQLVLTKRFKLIGPISNPTSWLSSLDAFILPSLWEGQGLVLLEAGLIGLPIIASAVDGVTELIDDTTGYLVPPGDAQTLAKKIDWLANNLTTPGVQQKTLALRQKIIANFSIEQITQKYQNLYRQLLNTKNYENIASK